MKFTIKRPGMLPHALICRWCENDDLELSELSSDGLVAIRCPTCWNHFQAPISTVRIADCPLNEEWLAVMRAAKSNKLWWSKREGGSECYQKYHSTIHKLVTKGLLTEFSEKSCCHRQYTLSNSGEVYLASCAAMK